MRMNKPLIQKYLSIVTSAPAADRTDPMSDINGFNSPIQAMHRRAEAADDTPWLRMALRDLLLERDDRMMEFRGLGYPFSKAQLERLFTHSYQQIWGTNPMLDEFPRLPLLYATMTEEEWAQEKANEADALDTDEDL